MQHLFIPSENGQQVLNGVRGSLRSYADTVKIKSPHPILTDADVAGVELFEPPAPVAPIIPQIATRMKFWLALYQLQGLTKEMVESSLPEDIPTRIVFYEASEISRTDPVFLGMMALLEKTDAEADAVFVLADSL